MFYKVLHRANDLKTPTDSRRLLTVFVKITVNINVAEILTQKKTYATFAINKIKRARLTVDLCVLWIVVIKVKQKYIFLTEALRF